MKLTETTPKPTPPPKTWQLEMTEEERSLLAGSVWIRYNSNFNADIAKHLRQLYNDLITPAQV